MLDAKAGLFDALYPNISRASGAETLGAKGATWIGVEKVEENGSLLITGFEGCDSCAALATAPF